MVREAAEDELDKLEGKTEEERQKSKTIRRKTLKSQSRRTVGFSGHMWDTGETRVGQHLLCLICVFCDFEDCGST